MVGGTQVFCPTTSLCSRILTDSDLLPRERIAAHHYIRERLSETHVTIRWLPSPHDGPWIRFAADAYSAPGWSSVNRVAVGDAAIGLDSLSSQGVLKALLSGQQAARAILSNIRGNPLALKQYSETMEKTFAIYMRERSQFYGSEQRWPRSPFWQRRHGNEDGSLVRRRGFEPKKTCRLWAGNP